MTRALVVSLTLVGASACMHAERSAPTPRSSAAQASGAGDAAMTHAGMEGMCPMSIPETRISAEDTATGEALTFTTSTDQVGALRERVRAMAAMHNQHHADAHAAHGMAGMSGARSEMTMPPPSQAAVEDVPEGARLVVTPKDPADLQHLQAAVREHAAGMQQHGCAMMSDEGPRG